MADPASMCRELGAAGPLEVAVRLRTRVARCASCEVDATVALVEWLRPELLSLLRVLDTPARWRQTRA